MALVPPQKAEVEFWEENEIVLSLELINLICQR